MNEMHPHHDDDEFRRLCGVPGPDDGVDPRLAARRQNRRRHRNATHHQLQLCKQARQAIDAAIHCDCGDPVFARLGPCEVTPQGRGNELLVTFAVGETDAATLEQLRTALEAVRGVLRSAVAGAIHRKRVPGLRIEVVPATLQ